MKLSRLEIFGFKSFAKKLDLRLTGGITSVVGPNGCGKSNVVDAIRWVLGEQRPTQIRLDRMEDVLFKGSTSRRPLGMSEVSLTIENNCGILPLDRPEITITRRLFRSGESDYLINKKACRLTDIAELLMDTGMGTDSYSVFELSMINAILSDKTDDRRHIFEEAAGITKYKARRKSALNKLAGIRDDLNRVGDIVTELDRRVDSLRRQASRARRYREIKTEIKERSMSVASHELGLLALTTDRESREIARLETDIGGLETTVARDTTDHERHEARITETETELADIARTYQESAAVIAESEREVMRVDARLEATRELIERSREERVRTAASLKSVAESHGSGAESLEKLTVQLGTLKEERIEAEHHLQEAVSIAEKARRAVDEIEAERRKFEADLGSARSECASLQVGQEHRSQRRSEVSAGMDATEAEIIGLNTDIDRASQDMLDSQSEEQSFMSTLTEQNARLDELARAREALDTTITGARERLTSLRAEHDILARVMASYEEYADGVRAAAGSDVLKGKVHGVLADLISVDDRYARAIRAALEHQLHHLLVDRASDAVDSIAHLTETTAGRASFLPLDAVAVSDEAGDALNGPGIVGPAIQFVTVDTHYEPVVRRLLAAVTIVDTLATAVSLTHAHPGHAFVSLDGGFAGGDGDIRGGTSTAESGYELGRAKKLERLAGDIAVLESEVSDLSEQRQKLDDTRVAHTHERDTAQEALAVVRNRRIELKGIDTRLNARKEALDESLSRLSKELDELGDSASGADSRQADLTPRIEHMEAELATLDSRRLEALAALNDSERERERRRAALNEHAVALAGLTEKRAALEREIADLGKRRESLAQTARRIEEEIEQAETTILDAGGRKKDLIAALGELERAHAEIRRGKEDVEHRHAELRAEQSDLNRAVQKRRRELDELTRARSAHTLARDEAEMKMRGITERLVDEFYIAPEDIVPQEPEPGFDATVVKLELEDMRRKLHNLGDVNLAAEADYKTEKERLDFLTRERDDLVTAGDKLRETIERINAIATDRFLQTFEQVRINFHKMFREFFDGGECDLVLEEGADPLETGINITARPPGKNVRTINLLSSGERALTAISLLFAIYLVKPSPFCILDEVDAPLDDANIDRFLRVIREFSNRTQFIMVTHNKKTMAAADNLYGITMEEAGLSSLVSVKLSDREEETTAA
jgi:chromosome segregation protein